jgi:HPt (histidine-containing phosphotransfer) domain-containing protein
VSQFDERMAKLKLRFAIRLEAEQLLLEQALASGDRLELKRLAHGLSGSAAIFGYADIGESAQALEAAADGGQSLREPAEALFQLMALALRSAGAAS